MNATHHGAAHRPLQSKALVETLEHRLLLSGMPPGAHLASAPDIASAGASSYEFAVLYSDEVGIDAASIGSGDVRVTGPNQYAEVAQIVSVSSANNGTFVTAKYRITPPGGSWSTADNGIYQMQLLGNEVADVNANFAAPGTLGSFKVAIDSVGPTAILSPLRGARKNGHVFRFTVTYRDDIGLEPSSIGTGDILVLGPNGYKQYATLLSVHQRGAGNSRALYEISAPGGTWDSPDRGNYCIWMVGKHVTDISGNGVKKARLGVLKIRM